MARYRVLKNFKDKYTKEIYEAGQEIEMTVKRANEAIKNLKKYGDNFLKRIDQKGED